MKLRIDALGRTLELILLDEPAPISKQLQEWRAYADYTSDGRLARILIMALDTYMGGAEVYNLDIDLAPKRDYKEAEVPDELMERLLKKAAEARPVTPMPSPDLRP